MAPSSVKYSNREKEEGKNVIEWSITRSGFNLLVFRVWIIFNCRLFSVSRSLSKVNTSKSAALWPPHFCVTQLHSHLCVCASLASDTASMCHDMLAWDRCTPDVNTLPYFLTASCLLRRQCLMTGTVVRGSKSSSRWMDFLSDRTNREQRRDGSPRWNCLESQRLRSCFLYGFLSSRPMAGQQWGTSHVFYYFFVWFILTKRFIQNAFVKSGVPQGSVCSRCRCKEQREEDVSKKLGALITAVFIFLVCSVFELDVFASETSAQVSNNTTVF